MRRWDKRCVPLLALGLASCNGILGNSPVSAESDAGAPDATAGDASDSNSDGSSSSGSGDGSASGSGSSGGGTGSGSGGGSGSSGGGSTSSDGSGSSGGGSSSGSTEGGVDAGCADAGGHCEIILATNQFVPSMLTFDSTYVYWADTGNGAMVAGTIERIPINGGTTQILATGGYPLGLAVNSSNVYWPDFLASNVMMAPLGGIADGGAGIVFAGSELSAQLMAIDANNLYWTLISGPVRKKALGSTGPAETLSTAAAFPGGLAVDANNVYFSDYHSAQAGAGAVYSVPIGGGTTSTLASSLDSPNSIAVDSSSVYFATKTQVLKIPLTGLPDGASPIVVATGLAQAEGVAVVGSTVYVADSISGTVLSAPSAGGGAVSTLVSGAMNAGPVVADAKNVYWATLQETGIVAQTSQ